VREEASVIKRLFYLIFSFTFYYMSFGDSSGFRWVSRRMVALPDIRPMRSTSGGGLPFEVNLNRDFVNNFKV
jgi:hypothetical protein